MYALKVYITPADIMSKLSDKDRERFNQCVFTDVSRGMDGSVTVSCVLFNDLEANVSEQRRQKYFSDGFLKFRR